MAKGESHTIKVPTGKITLKSDDVLVETSSADGFACGEDAGFLTALDTTLNDELVSEGIARELIRTVQDARKQAGLEVSDRIMLGVSGADGVEKALSQYRDYIMSETLATKWQIGQADPIHKAEKSLGTEHWAIEISRIN